jgi:hypothetical protein
MRTSLAWVLLVAVAACGDDGGSSPDAADHDAELADAEVPDADVSGPATITVMSEGNPIPGIDVVFSNPDGSVLSQMTTNASGEATETVLPGSAGTIAVMIPGAPPGGPTGNGYAAISWLGIEPGDDLVWTFDAPQPATFGDLTVNLPGDFGGATQYEVHLGCTSFFAADGTTPVTGTIAEDCLGTDQNIDVLAIALDDGGAPVAFSYDNELAVAAGTTVTMPAWQTTFDPLTVTLTNAPAAAAGAGMETSWDINGLDFQGFGGGGGFTAGTATLQSGYPTGGIVDRLEYSVFIQLGPQPEDGTGVILASYTDTPATASHDLSSVLLPAIGNATVGNAQGRAELAWTSSGSFASADGSLWLTSWDDGPDLHQWFVMTPPGVSNPFQLPEMPEDLAAFRTTGTAVFDTPTAIFIEGDFIADYAAFRPIGYQLFNGGPGQILPATGGLLRASLGGQAPGGP